MEIKVLFFILVHQGGMLHYGTQLIKHLPKNIHPILITGMIDNKITSKDHNISLKRENLFVEYKIIRNIIGKDNPDIIHITSGHYLLLPLLFLERKIPIVVTIHDLTPHPGEDNILTRFIIKKQIHRANHIFVHGSIHKHELEKMNIPSTRVTVVPHGDYSFFMRNKKQIMVEENAILFFGRIIPYKGLNYLLEVMIELQFQLPVKLIIAGSGDISPYQKQIDMISSDLIEIYNDFIPDDKVAPFFQRAKMVVLPYIEASQSGIIPIAYSFKKPVIASNVGALQEVVEDGVTGFLIPPKDTIRLKECITTLMMNEKMRMEMGLKAFEKMKSELSWDDVALKTSDLYSNLLKIRC